MIDLETGIQRSNTVDFRAVDESATLALEGRMQRAQKIERVHVPVLRTIGRPNHGRPYLGYHFLQSIVAQIAKRIVAVECFTEIGEALHRHFRICFR